MSSMLFADAAAGQWYTLKAVIKGNRILGFVDGQLKLEWTNPQTELTAGKIGFRTTSQNAVFDNARVTGIHKVTANALKTVTQDVYEAVTPEGNRLSLSPGSPLAGETLTLTAEGHNQSLAPVAPGDERYYPEAWSSTEDGMAGVFTVTDEVYQATYLPSAPGDYKITVIYRKQVWDGTAWADTELTDSLIVDIKVIQKPADVKDDTTTELDQQVLG
ncbi:hypothetical protein ACFSQ7_02165 [Paenibacillus rhizoplanae]